MNVAELERLVDSVERAWGHTAKMKELENMAPYLARRVIAAEGLVEALNQSVTAINDWLHIYAGDFCHEADLAEAKRRVYENGTLSYIARVQSVNTEALTAYEATK